MNLIRLAAVAAISIFALATCGKDEGAPVPGEAGNSLLSYVPEGAPYLGGNLELTPNEVIDGFLHKLEPVSATLQAELAKVRVRMESHPDTVDTASRLALAVLQEVDGKLNRPGLESLGFDLQAQQVFYGMGPFPVARLSLGDATALDATVQRILGRAGITAPKLNLEGHEYWRLAADDSPEFPAGLYIAITEDHIAFGVFPTTAESELLPSFLGIQKPASSDAETRLQAVTTKYGYTPYFSGLVDLQLLADEFLKPDSLLARSIGHDYGDKLATLSQECRMEFAEIIGHTPRLVMGSTELTPGAIGMQYVVETEPAMAQQLLQLVAELPLPEAITSRVLEFSFGIKVGAARDFLREKALAIVQAPFQCEHLVELNEHATDGLAQLEQPLPPFINNFRGLRLSLSQFNLDQSVPNAVQGLIAVHVEQPEMFVGMAQMFLPDLSGLTLVKGDPPVPLPAGLIPMSDTVAFAAMSETAIGVSVGAGEENALLPYLGRDPSADGTILSVNYDTASYLDLTQGMGDALLHESEKRASEDGDDAAVAGQIAIALRESYKSVADRSELKLRFTSDGVVIDSRMTFK